MIWRVAGEELVVVKQMEHARLAADLAAEVGNAQFASPMPRGPMLDAAAMHDCGWPAHDDAPTITAHGAPAHALEMPLGVMLPIWSASTDSSAAKNPYAGLLVSLHGLHLSLRAHVDPSATPLVFALNKFQHRQIEVQEELRKRLAMRIDKPLRYGLAEPNSAAEEDLLRFNFTLLEMADQLSLNLCFGEIRLPQIDHVPVRPGGQFVSVRFAIGPAGEYSVSPWPFGREEFEVSFTVRSIPARRYTDHDDLRRALNSAADRKQSLRLRRQVS
ncbi:MAG TPA: DUF3891 family protein [Tepidisphaeraceae bacterium]|nr:DUF3891 family protein [Tepidisphaeraceae bacterium]